MTSENPGGEFTSGMWSSASVWLGRSPVRALITQVSFVVDPLSLRPPAVSNVFKLLLAFVGK